LGTIWLQARRTAAQHGRTPCSNQKKKKKKKPPEKKPSILLHTGPMALPKFSNVPPAKEGVHSSTCLLVAKLGKPAKQKARSALQLCTLWHIEQWRAQL
jgi:hypothetical protein